MDVIDLPVVSIETKLTEALDISLKGSPTGKPAIFKAKYVCGTRINRSYESPNVR